MTNEPPHDGIRILYDSKNQQVSILASGRPIPDLTEVRTIHNVRTGAVEAIDVTFGMEAALFEQYVLGMKPVSPVGQKVPCSARLSASDYPIEIDSELFDRQPEPVAPAAPHGDIRPESDG